MIDNEQLGIVIDMPGLRVRYGATATPRITNMYLSPTNDADAGFVELEDQDIYFARADMRALPKPNSRAKARPGPKKSFDHVFAVCVDYFRQFGFTQSNSEVRAALEAMRPEIEPLPKKTRERELINEARDLVRNEPIAIRNSDLTATDAL
ncbi:MAG: hypothetical protein ACTS1Z_15095 [Parasphingopyxis sp.]|uniref:hypothetical protein n=1 Tax=Parasphingopyxis sp. TaxID=1920299 RepID=UPI003FA06E9E